MGATCKSEGQENLDAGWATDDAWSLDGWAVSADPEAERMRSLPPAGVNAVEDRELLDEGWTLAEGTDHHNLEVLHQPPPLPPPPEAVASRPQIVARAFFPTPIEMELAPERQAEFSEPDLALGTDVDLPQPTDMWFAELRPLVTKQSGEPLGHGTASTHTSSTNISDERSDTTSESSSFSSLEDEFFATGEDLSLQAQRVEITESHEDERVEPGKKSWWRRRFGRRA